MNRLFVLVGSAIVAGIVGWVPAAHAQASTRPAFDGPGARMVSALSGSIEGTVVDERGAPLAGAMVSALGATSAA
jgi:protocatechuate 3,4-dioxygenase beta subunit